MRNIAKPEVKIKLPPAHDWRTTDTDEINKRRIRAREESFVITNTDARHPIFSNFRVKSASGLTYSVEIRGLSGQQCACDCVDFRTNGLGLCKHTEAVLLYLEARHKKHFKSAQAIGSNRIEVAVDAAANLLCVQNCRNKLPRAVSKRFDADGRLLDDSPEAVVDTLRKLRESDHPQFRSSQEVEPWLENRRRAAERGQL